MCDVYCIYVVWVYSVNVCGVTWWTAIMVVLPFKCLLDYNGVVSGMSGFMRMMQRIHGHADPSSKRLGKKKTERSYRKY